MPVRLLVLALGALLSVPSWAQDAVAGWPTVATISPDHLRPRDQFGSAVAKDGDRLLIGARGTDVGGQQQAGAAYVYRWNGSEWVEEARLVASDFFRDSRFGSAVALEGDRAVVGAPWSPPWYSHNEPEPQPGAVYVFERDEVGIWHEVARMEAPAPTRLAVFDALGRTVALLVDGPRAPGEHRATWDASSWPPGVYVWRLTAGDRVETGRVTVVR